MIKKKDTGEIEEEKTTIKKTKKVVDNVYSFPTLRKSAKGKNKEEAHKKIKK